MHYPETGTILPGAYQESLKEPAENGPVAGVSPQRLRRRSNADMGSCIGSFSLPTFRTSFCILNATHPLHYLSTNYLPPTAV